MSGRADQAYDRCEHCLASFPPVTGGSDVCECPCHKSSFFQRTIGWRPPQLRDSAVPVPVLEALASAWEDQAGKSISDEAEAQRQCASELREAITHGRQG